MKCSQEGPAHTPSSLHPHAQLTTAHFNGSVIETRLPEDAIQRTGRQLFRAVHRPDQLEFDSASVGGFVFVSLCSVVIRQLPRLALQASLDARQLERERIRERSILVSLLR
jgi:hypothetical protein